jgi:hypothetical protein
MSCNRKDMLGLVRNMTQGEFMLAYSCNYHQWKQRFLDNKVQFILEPGERLPLV